MLDRTVGRLAAAGAIFRIRDHDDSDDSAARGDTVETKGGWRLFHRPAGRDQNRLPILKPYIRGGRYWAATNAPTAPLETMDPDFTVASERLFTYRLAYQ